MLKLTYYLYNRLPGQHPGYTLAVLATGRNDANQYVKTWWKGGTYAGKVTGGSVDAHCGAVTEAAQAVLRERLR